MSWRVWFMHFVLFPLMGSKRALAKVTDGAALATWPKKDAALPPARLYRKFLIEDSQVRGRTVYTIAPRYGETAKCILYLHGGGYVMDLASLHWNVVAGLIDRTAASVVVPLYPLAPQHDCEDALALLLPLLLDLSERWGAANIVIAGDSAGGGIAMALAQVLRDRKQPAPAGLLLLSPWLDVTLSDPGQAELDRKDNMLAIPGLRVAGQSWAGSLSPEDPRVSPLFGSLEGLPPIAVFTGTYDLLNSDAHRLVDKARRGIADVRLFEYPRMPHVWMLASVPEGRRALDEGAAFINSLWR